MPQGPRWVGDNKPDLPPELQYAQELPPLVTENYVFFFVRTRPFSDPLQLHEATGFLRQNVSGANVQLL